MARVPKNGKSGPTKTVATTLLMPDSKTVQALAKSRRSTQKRTREISGEFGNEVGKAVEKKHVDRKALSIACQLNDMSAEKLHVTYFHMLRYLDDLGVPERATAQQELFDQGPQEGAETEADEGEGNVTRIGRAARNVAEQAGAVG